ncbi:MAG: glycosyltransferase, partial [Dokdonella sp.]
GIRLEPFADADAHPFLQRVPGIVMVARFSRQKDHATLLLAVAMLRGRGLQPPVMLCGGGKRRAPVKALAAQLGLLDQVQFLGVCDDVPGLLLRHQLAVLATHHEGMPLALLEGMAAGCAVVGSDVQGVREVIDDGENGRLVPAQDARALADTLESLLREPAQAARLAAAARRTAIERHGRKLMNRRYEALFLELANKSPSNDG